MAVEDLTVVRDIETVSGDFDDAALTAALSGKTLLYKDSSSSALYSNNYVLNFRKASAGAPMPYVGEIEGSFVYFDKAGKSQDGKLQLALGSSEININFQQGESQTRSGGESFIMNALNYKEQVALNILSSIIIHEPNPLSYDDAKVKLLVAKAFRIAIEFQNRAIEFRMNDESGEVPEEQIAIDPNTLTNNTDKLLYNINASLNDIEVTVHYEDEEQ